MASVVDIHLPAEQAMHESGVVLAVVPVIWYLPIPQFVQVLVV